MRRSESNPLLSELNCHFLRYTEINSSRHSIPWFARWLTTSIQHVELLNAMPTFTNLMFFFSFLFFPLGHSSGAIIYIDFYYICRYYCSLLTEQLNFFVFVCSTCILVRMSEITGLILNVWKHYTCFRADWYTLSNGLSY